MAEAKLPDGRKLVYVDGFKIRNFIDEDFGIIHGHSQNIYEFVPKFYIPQNEVWYDRRYADEFKFLYKGMVFELSVPVGSSDERRAAIKKELCLPEPVPEVTMEKKKDGDLTVVMVDGKNIRAYIDPEFILGGHEFIYDYVPASEVWIDVKIDPAEIPYILLHEKVERELMAKGKNYDVAHEYATIADKEERRAKAGACYPGDADYPWYGKENSEIISNVITDKK
jgi:hypothetical protein